MSFSGQAGGILLRAAGLLMEGTPKEIDLEKTVTAIVVLDGLKDIHHTCSWVPTSGKNFFSASAHSRRHRQRGVCPKSTCHAEIAVRVLIRDFSDRDHLS